jgi:hypothetical protein
LDKPRFAGHGGPVPPGWWFSAKGISPDGHWLPMAALWRFFTVGFQELGLILPLADVTRHCDWLAFFSCLLTSARKENRKLQFQKSIKRTLAEMVGYDSLAGELFHEPVQEVASFATTVSWKSTSSLLNIVLRD